MLTIRGRNVNDILPVGILHLTGGEQRQSRNGPVLEIPTPVSVRYDCPDERVLFEPKRDANPFFHLFESLWMLAGRNDVAFLDQYNSRMKQYSDDGQGFNAAYGQRLRSGFGFDQIEECIQRLRKDPDDRRIVLQIWDPADMLKQTVDMACNLVITPRVRKGCLDWTVFNRSNDYLFGLTGANAVHLSVIHEYVARMSGILLGSYEQITNCCHAYVETPVWQATKDLPLSVNDPYNNGVVKPFPLISERNVWNSDLVRWMEDPKGNRTYTDPFFEHVAKPMAITHYEHKVNRNGLKYVGLISASDWRKACTEWLERRECDTSVQGG